MGLLFAVKTLSTASLSTLSQPEFAHLKRLPAWGPLSPQYCCVSKQSTAVSCADFLDSKRTTFNTTFTQPPLASRDPCRNKHIPNRSFLYNIDDLSIHNHGIEITGNRTLGVRSFWLYCSISKWIGKIPWEATCYCYIALLAHTRTLLDHRSYRHFLWLDLMRTEEQGRIEIEAMAGSRS